MNESHCPFRIEHSYLLLVLYSVRPIRASVCFFLSLEITSKKTISIPWFICIYVKQEKRNAQSNHWFIRRISSWIIIIIVLFRFIFFCNSKEKRVAHLLCFIAYWLSINPQRFIYANAHRNTYKWFRIGRYYRINSMKNASNRCVYIFTNTYFHVAIKKSEKKYADNTSRR